MIHTDGDHPLPEVWSVRRESADPTPGPGRCGVVARIAPPWVLLRFERTHRPIFGSEIAALHLMNQQGPQPESAIKPIFEAARSKEPQFYGSYTFEKWIGFVIGEIAVRCDNGLYGITVFGRSYLDYIGIFAPYPKPH